MNEIEQLIDREFDILCTLADAGGWLSLEQLAESILDTSPGPRCARSYATECAWRLEKIGFIERHERKTALYQITRLGRRLLESPTD